MASKTNPFTFLQQVRSETSKVTWPTRRETMISTAMVFIMAGLAAAFFFLARLYIRVGNKSFTISAGEADEPSAKVKAALTALGKMAVPRMK